MLKRLRIIAVNGWALPDVWFREQVLLAFPDAEVTIFAPEHPEDSKEAQQLLSATSADLYLGYSLGSLWLLKNQDQLPHSCIKALVAPILAFPTEMNLGGKTSSTQIKYLIRILSRDPDRCRILAGKPAPASELRKRWREAGGTDHSQTLSLPEFVSRQAALALERAERQLRGARYKVPRLVDEEILGRPAFRAGLAKLARDFKPFGAAAISRALARGKRSRGSITAWHIAGSTFTWSPGPGQELWVISGSAGDNSLVAAFHVMPDGKAIHAASTVVAEADSSIALGYTEDKPSTLLWTTCFGCPGEGGDLIVGEDKLVRFTYR